MNPQQLVAKRWNYGHVPRDDGLAYGDDVEQRTSLLFLEVAHEHTGAPDGRWRAYDDAELAARDGASLDVFWLKDEALEAALGAGAAAR